MSSSSVDCHIILANNHSKHFCGLAEVLDCNPKEITDFWEESITYEGYVEHTAVVNACLTISSTMDLRWLYCKVVPYDEIRRVVEPNHPTVSTTQMWNGMQ